LPKKYKSKNREDYFYQIRDLDRDTEKFDGLTDIEKAARLIFLNEPPHGKREPKVRRGIKPDFANKTCFNGLYRMNSQGVFNVPCGKYKNLAICEEIVLRQISEYLNDNEIVILNDCCPV
jgi:DNA adenine methylase